MTVAFCTIITYDYLHYALALRQSLMKFGKEVDFYIHISDCDDTSKSIIEERFTDTFVLYNKDLCGEGIGRRIYTKYYDLDISAFRWSMKPVLLKYLLAGKSYEKVVFLDADIYFFNDYKFLLDELDTCDVLLSPDWRSSNPHADLINFQKLYKEGIYNGGFVGANKDSIKAIDWWAMACEFICVNDPIAGMYYDQIHLNMLPAYFERVGVIRHKGCNVANWNLFECSRSAGANNQSVLIADEYPIVFLHFSTTTVNGILQGEDPLLLPYLEHFFSVINQYSSEIEKMGLRIESPEKKQNHPTNNGETKVSDPGDTAPGKLDFAEYYKASVANSVKASARYLKGNILNLTLDDDSYKGYILGQSSVAEYKNLDIKGAWNYDITNTSEPLWSGNTIPFEDKKFDCVVATDVLQNSPNPAIFLKEINRVIEKQGAFFFTIPFLEPAGENEKARYSIFELKKLLNETGFVNTDIKALGGWHASMALMLGSWLNNSPLSRRRKKILSLILKPVIKYLLKVEKFSKVNLDSGPMITGLSGITFKK